LVSVLSVDTEKARAYINEYQEGDFLPFHVFPEGEYEKARIPRVRFVLLA